MDVEETKKLTERKVDKARVEALEKEVEELRNRSIEKTWYFTLVID